MLEMAHSGGKVIHSWSFLCYGFLVIGCCFISDLKDVLRALATVKKGYYNQQSYPYNYNQPSNPNNYNQQANPYKQKEQQKQTQQMPCTYY